MSVSGVQRPECLGPYPQCPLKGVSDVHSGCMGLIHAQDHFGIILNEPAGKVAKVVVEHSVNIVVQVCHVDVAPTSTVIFNSILVEGLVGQLKPR